MIFQQVYGVGKRTVTLHGAANSSITIDESTTISLNSSGEASVELKYGDHTFKDNYVNVTKTFRVGAGTTDIACGVWFGGAGTKTLPTGVYTTIRGHVSGSVSQTGQGGSAQSPCPGCRTSASATYSGAAAGTLYSGNIASMAWGAAGKVYTPRSYSDSTNPVKSMGTITGGSLTVSFSYSVSQDSGNAYVNVSGSASLSNVYVY